MDLKAYYKLISSERTARKYLSRKCRKNGHRFCPRCGQRKLYKLADERYRCSRCDYTFHDFSGRWINYGRLSAVQWLSLIKLFELEVSVRKMSLQLGLSYRAVYGAAAKAIEAGGRPAKCLCSASWSGQAGFMSRLCRMSRPLRC